MICFRQSRLKLTIHTTAIAAWTVVLGFMAFVSAHAAGLWPYLALSLFAPLAIAGAVAAVAGALGLARPATLSADADGVAFRTWRGARTIAWQDIAAFHVLSPTSALRSPGCELKQGVRKFVSFGRNWEKSAEEIVEALGEAEEARGSEHP